MSPDHLNEIGESDILRKRLAKWMAQFCFRNTMLEDLHDRISDDEMKELTTDSVNHCYALLTVLFFKTHRAYDIIELLKEHDPVPEWNEPEMPPTLLKGVKQLQDLGVLP
jgi:hypothetical protein